MRLSLPMTLRTAAFLLLTAPLTASIAEDSFSEANERLFRTPHLLQLEQPGATLDYRYKRMDNAHYDEESVPANALPRDFEDRIKLTITSVDEQWRGTELALFTGERNIYFPTMQRSRGNPLLMAFLTHDVTRMSHKTSAPVRYFQNRIKTALEEESELTETTIRFDGQDVPGHEIVITPYSNDPDKARYDGNYWDKRYVFTVSEQIPGYIYSIEAVAPGMEHMENGNADYWQFDKVVLDKVSTQ